ncbi:MAG: PHP domain-containing protein [Acidimicrobiales bacterium]|nr:PHP domain-containing protein [Acidimicrobiales bacterium]
MYSGDSTTTLEEIENYVLASKLDVVCITDHGTVRGALKLQKSLDIKVIVGQECKTSVGEVIGLFLKERIPPGLSPKDCAIEIRKQGGLVSIPHPFDPMRHALGDSELYSLLSLGLVDVIEVLNSKSSLTSARQKAQNIAEEFSLGQVSGSDAHVPQAFGASYVEMPQFESAQSFKENLKQARIVGHFFDPPRTWSPRIVPSTKN